MADLSTIGTVLLGSFFLLVFLNVPITVSLGLSALGVMVLFGLTPDAYTDIMYTGLSKFSLLAVPFFILAGYVMMATGISNRVIDFANLFVGRIPGGLALMACAVTCFWGAVSGSGPATVAALGAILIPALIKAGYGKAFSAALIAAVAGTSVVIPPSSAFILYGTITGESIGTLFTAGVIPGSLMGICFAIYIIIYSIKHKIKAKGKFGTPKEMWHSFKGAFWGLLAPVICLGGIYGGIFTPTEAAMVTVWYALFVGIVIYRTFKPKDFLGMLSEAGITSASVLIILANAAVFGWLLTSYGIANNYSRMLLSISDNPVIITLLMLLILIVVDLFLDLNSEYFIFVPIFLPVIKSFGMSPIWLGVMMAMAGAVGFCTPPVAVNLYPAARIAGIDLKEISIGVIGFVIAGFVAVIMCILWPEIIMWLPRRLGMVR
jgi:C4-dicarboxylate transporter DctM subunit